MKKILTFIGIDDIDEGIMSFGYKCRNFYIYICFDLSRSNCDFFELRESDIIKLWKLDLCKSKLSCNNLKFLLKEYE